MSGSLYLKQKASKWTPFVFLSLLLCSPAINAASCTSDHFHETVEIEKVYDGDTVKLTDGRKLRLIGINTPERGRDGHQDQPFYHEAKVLLEDVIKHNQSQLKIVFGKDKHDRHKRVLAHLFTLNGTNISEVLLKKGMGFSIAIPPNTQFLNCYQAAEREAKKLKLAIWGHPFSRAIHATALDKTVRGFHQVSGTVQRVGESSSSYWLNLDKHFALRILKKDLPYFNTFQPKDLLNKKLVARGWIYQASNEHRMTIRHPAALQLQNTD